MAGSLSMFGREWLLKLAFRNEQVLSGNLRAALTKNVADVAHSASNLDEPASLTNYSRVLMSVGTNWTYSSGEIAYSANVLFSPPTGPWGLILGWAVVDDGGHLIGSGPLQLPRRFQPGAQARIPAGFIRFRLFD